VGKRVLSVEELGVEDWVPGHLREVEEPKRSYHRWNRILSEPSARKKEYEAFNGMLFMVFAAPTLLAALFLGAENMGFPYYMVAVWVHEAGHGFWCLLGSRIFCSFGGTFNELLLTAVPAMICLRKREMYYGACVLLMCAALTCQHAGSYMQSAEHPRGYGFAGVRMTEDTHDWSVIFLELGVIEDAYNIGVFTEQLGEALAIVLLIAAVFGIIPMLSGWVPEKITDLISPGAAAALLYFLFSSATTTQLTTALLLTIPLVPRLIRHKPSS
jgi:hypothetical protein